jgi:ribonuclease P/MRP protein subunit RPP1
MFYDLHVRAEAGKAARMAKRLGLSGIGLTVQSNRTNSSLKVSAKEGRCQEAPSGHSDAFFPKSEEVEGLREAAKSLGVDAAIGIELQGRPNQIPNLAKNVRMQYELVLVRGGSEEVNRAALETPEVDILIHPGLENGMCGINHILARLGARNNVAVCFDLLEIIQAYKKTRANLLSGLMETARFVRKYRCPFVLSAGAMAEWDMRGPSELIAFGKFLGFQENECRKALDGGILRENRKRLSGKWVMPGVEVE